MSDDTPRGARRVGIRDVAARASVGISTVSRVLSGRVAVRPDLRDRVLAAAAELGYRPDVLAQSLRTGATRSVGFIADDLGNHLIAEIATGAESVLRASGYSLLVMNSELDPRLDPENIAVLLARRVDALMVCPVEEDDPATIEALRSSGIPLCVVEGDLPSSVAASYVVSDHRGGTLAAVRHLLSLGHRRIGLITGPLRYRSARERLLGLHDAEAEAGVQLGHRAVELTDAGALEAASDLLAADDAPTAIVVGGDRLLVGVLRALDAASMNPGEDVSLVTCDPMAIATMFRPPLASISRDSAGIGRSAAELLLAQLADPARASERVELPVTYQPRASVIPVDRVGRRASHRRATLARG